MGSRSRSRAGTGTITPTITPPPGSAIPMGPAPGAAAPMPGLGSRPASPPGPAYQQMPYPGAANAGFPPPGEYDAMLNETLAGAAAESQLAGAAREEERQRWPDEPEVSYAEDPDAFQAAYRQALERRDRGEAAVPYMTEDATGGLGMRDVGRPFGTEIEFDLGPEVYDRQAALAAIGRDLHAAGLTSSPRQRPYHSTRGAVSHEHAGGWRFETDSTVDGEIVSPVMWDEPQTWQNLQQVCEIVRRHGGRATARTGGHVHVGLEDYDHTVENHNRLLSTVDGYSDTLYRLAQNPEASRHRGTSWCAPNTVPSAGYHSVASVRARNNSHNFGMNFQSVHGNRSDHVEYRMWDGSLDPGVIQAHINMSLGMTAAAARGGYTPPHREPVGTHRAANPARRRLRREQWRESTRGFRQLTDTLFRRASNSAQAAALFAVTRWQQ